MRVISQFGLIDVPYERCVFSIENEYNKIYCTLLGAESTAIMMAKYTTRERAERAMELLHEAYTGKSLFLKKKEVTPADRAAAGEISWSQALTEMNCNRIVGIQPESKFENVWNWNIVFRFPKEEELER